MSQTDVWWKLHLKNQVDILADYGLTEWSNANVITRGENRRINLHFNTQEDLTVSSSYTVASGDIEQYGDIVVQSGATLTINGELYANTLDNNGTVDNNGTLTLYGDNAGLFDRLDNYADWAGKYSNLTMLDGTEKYREQIPSTADVNSILVGLEPSPTLQNRGVSGIWGLVQSGTDQRPIAISDTQYEIELQVLAEFDEYADHATVKTDLEV